MTNIIFRSRGEIGRVQAANFQAMMGLVAERHPAYQHARSRIGDLGDTMKSRRVLDLRST